jgi:nucleoside 2-deoxyribosyltransferase
MQDEIYLAGPLFSLAERSFNKALADKLRSRGYRVFVPQEHPQEDAPPKEVFDRDTQALRNARIVVANLDGPDPDSGTSWECGYAYGIGKTVIAFRTDVRPNEEHDKTPVNLMLAVSAKPLLDLRYGEDRRPPTMEQLLDRIIDAITPILRRR